MLVIPKSKKNLISIGQIAKDAKCTIEFNTYGFVVKN